MSFNNPISSLTGTGPFEGGQIGMAFALNPMSVSAAPEPSALGMMFGGAVVILLFVWKWQRQTT